MGIPITDWLQSSLIKDPVYFNKQARILKELVSNILKEEKGDKKMTALLIILAAIALLIIGYITYGSWLAKQWVSTPQEKLLLLRKRMALTM